MTKAVSNTDDMRRTAKHCLPPDGGPCKTCDLSVGFVCDLCEAARELFLAARTIDDLRAAVTQLKGALSDVEWAGCAHLYEYEALGVCPCCDARLFLHQKSQHDAGCKLKAALDA